jgi:hypothetical protein
MAAFPTMSTRSLTLRSLASGPVRFAWDLLRLPILGVLVLLAPAVQFICGGLMVFGILVSIAFRISGVGASFPFWHMIGASLGFGAFVVLYYGLIALLSR